MRIAVISDTHGLLRDEVKKILFECDGIIHAGDIADETTWNALLEISKRAKGQVPFYAVRGNNDRGHWARALQKTLTFELDQIRFFLVHDKKDIPAQRKKTDIVIYGHSHKYACEEKDGTLFLNPGSCGRRRFRQDMTMALLTLQSGKWNVEKREFFPGIEKAPGNFVPPDPSPALIGEIMARMDRGQTVETIAGKMKLDQGFVTEICRIRVTHPGVTAEGIRNKIEANEAGQRQAAQR